MIELKYSKREKLTYPNVHQISKHITFNQKKLAKKEKWMTNAETEFNQKKILYDII